MYKFVDYATPDILYANEPFDDYDTNKWDFSEDSLKRYYFKGYLYKVNNKEDIFVLHGIRNEITRLNDELKKFINERTAYSIVKSIYNKYKKDNEYSLEEFIEGINLFIDIHDEKMRSYNFYLLPYFKTHSFTSAYLLSSLPNTKDAHRFQGINKPRLRYESSEPSTGRDHSTRCMYRDILLDLKLKVDDPKEFRDLILHELAHAMAGHVRYRDSLNHKGDFKQAQELLTLLANRIDFLG